MVEVKSITKKFNSFVAVDDLSFKANDGEILGIIGPNGSGKTTTLKMISGILNPTFGEIFINDISMIKNSVLAKEKIGFISDSPDVMLRLKGIEFLNFIADMYDVKKEMRKELILELSEKFEMTDNLNKPILSYSHGMRQKLMIISALLHNPDVWILDEPLTGLDPKSAFILKQMMKEHVKKNKTVIFSTHILEVVEKLVDRIILIFKGKKIFDGKIEELKEIYKDKSLEEIYIIITNENS